MKITVISGSHRNPSQSYKVAEVVQQTLLNGICEQAEIFSLKDNPLPLWDSGVWDGEQKWKELLGPVKKLFSESDAFVVVSPEWHGQVPSGLKNLFLLLSKNEVGHKPALIVTVSSGRGGAYPVAELRMSSYKNNRICYIPEHVIVRDVESILNGDKADNDEKSDAFYRERIQWSLNILAQYAIALRQVRESGVTESSKFKTGM